MNVLTKILLFASVCVVFGVAWLLWPVDKDEGGGGGGSGGGERGPTTCGEWYDTESTTCDENRYIDRGQECPSDGECSEDYCCKTEPDRVQGTYCTDDICSDDKHPKEGPHIKCIQDPCTESECCTEYPTCETFTGDCPTDSSALPTTTRCEAAECTVSDCCVNEDRYNPEGVGLPNRDINGGPQGVSYYLRSVGKAAKDGGWGGWCYKTSIYDAIECDISNMTNAEKFKIYAAPGGQSGWVITTADEVDEHCKLDDDGLLECDYELGEATHFSLAPIGQHSLGVVNVPGTPSSGKTGYFAITAGGQPAHGNGPGYSCGINDDDQIKCDMSYPRHDFANLPVGRG